MSELLLNIATKATFVLLAAGLASLALKRASAAARHLVWMAAIAGVLILPLLIVALPRWDVAVNMPSVPAAQVILSQPGTAGAVPINTTDRPLVILWAAGVFAILLRLLIGGVRIQRWIRTAERFPVGRDGATLLVSDRVTTPMVWGILRPVILLPVKAREWSADRLGVVLEHELTHIRRKDWLTQILSQIACALYWFHPLVWWASRELRKEREHACDDAVLLSGARGTMYAEHLVELARHFQAAHGAVSMAEPSLLESRLRSILDPKRRRMLLAPRVAATAAAVALCVIIPLAAVRARAQGPAALAGVVQDASGARVPDATIIVSFSESGRIELVNSNAAGEYAIPGLPASHYRIEVRRPGFAAFRREGTLQDGPQRVDIALELGAVSETLEIVAKGQRAPVMTASTGRPQRIRVGGNVQATRLLQSVRPVYPDSAKLAGIEGTVLLEAVISREGRLIGLRAVNTMAHPDLVKAAQDAVSQWQYQPTLLNGQPIEVVTTITLNFRLEQ